MRNELTHSGIKGMKWGIRKNIIKRMQNGIGVL
jgi:hypothetical protein